MKLFLVNLLLAILPILIDADSAHDIKILKLQVKALINMQTQTNTKLTQTSQTMNQKLVQANQKLQALETKDQILNGYCKTKSNACGSCYCVEDFNIPAKYYCDCRGKPTRRDCKEHYIQGERINGLYRINHNTIGKEVPVYCDQTTDGGGWTLIQRRVDGSTNFFRNWQTYKRGFGQLQHEHWIGNDNIHLLTAQAVLTGSEVRFELEVKDASTYYAKYSNFHIDEESNAYQLHISGFSGNLNDYMAYHNGMKWTTPDRDNDKWSKNCAYQRLSSWWFNQCSESNLNGPYSEFTRHDGSHQYTTFSWYTHRLQFSEMKVRRK